MARARSPPVGAAVPVRPYLVSTAMPVFFGSILGGLAILLVGGLTAALTAAGGGRLLGVTPRG